MNLNKVNFTNILEETKYSLNNKTRPSFKFTIDNLYHMVAALRLLEPKQTYNSKFSVEKTVQAIPQDGIDTDFAHLSNRQFRDMINFLYLAPRSWIVPSMTVNTELASMTPLFLYAMKTAYNIEYSSWDTEDSFIHVALGKSLAPIVKYSLSNVVRKYTQEVDWITTARKEALTYRTGRKMGTMEGLISHKMNEVSISPVVLVNNEVIDTSKFPKICWYMVLQTWLCNASIRQPGVMILDPWDWDYVPEAYDLVAVTAPNTKLSDKVKKRNIPVEEDLL